jgi:hypothetical protein
MNSASVINPSMVKADFVGAVQCGPVAVPGLKVGDVVLLTMPNASAVFEPIVSADDEIQQIVNVDFSQTPMTFYLMRGV